MNYTIKIDYNEKQAEKIIQLVKEQVNSTKDGQLWNRLIEEQQNELLKIEKEVQSGIGLIPNEQMKAKHKKWL